MTNSYWDYISSNELYHHGIMGQKWGIRRFQNEDGTLTAAGRARLKRTGKYEVRNAKLEKKVASLDKKAADARAKANEIHAKNDLGGVDKYIKKASKYDVKSAKYEKKASKESDAYEKSRYEAKSQEYRYKSKTQQSMADRVAKQTGYGVAAMKANAKANNIELKAEKARVKMMNNEMYIAFTKKSLGDISEYTIKGKKLLR